MSLVDSAELMYVLKCWKSVAEQSLGCRMYVKKPLASGGALFDAFTYTRPLTAMAMYQSEASTPSATP